MANISRDQTVQYIVTMIDDILQVYFSLMLHFLTIFKCFVFCFPASSFVIIVEDLE